MGPQIVEAYEALFFTVRESSSIDYILNVIMRHAVARGVSEREYDFYLKLYAYFYGPHFLSACLAVLSSIRSGAGQPTGSGVLLKTTRLPA